MSTSNMTNLDVDEIADAMHVAVVREAYRTGDHPGYRTMALAAARVIACTQEPDEVLVSFCEYEISQRYDLDVTDESLAEGIIEALGELVPLDEALRASGALTIDGAN